MPTSDQKEKNQSTRDRRFPFHPFEVFIFLAITSAFAHSVFRIANEWKPESVATPVERNIASSNRSHIFIGCDSKITETVTTEFVQIRGRLCGLEETRNTVLEEFRLTSESSNTSKGPTTTFVDTSSKQYRSEAIQLNPGTNRFRATFRYNDNTVIHQDIELEKKL